MLTLVSDYSPAHFVNQVSIGVNEVSSEMVEIPSDGERARTDRSVVFQGAIRHNSQEQPVQVLNSQASSDLQ